MHIVQVFIRVHAEHVAAFQAATLDNAQHSRQEPGVARFDVLQQADDPTRFTLVEVYRASADQAQHRTTAHYRRWRDAVAPMLAEPRTATVYTNVSPADGEW